MHIKEFIFTLAILTQACGTPMPAPPPPTDPPRILQGLFERARETSTKVKDVGGAVFSYFSTYYEDHIQPVKDSYAEWASGIKGALWEKIQTTFDHYMPMKAN